MITITVPIVNKLGLHARAAAKFVELASRHQAHIEVEANGRKVNGKSIMGVMMLAASKGTDIILYVNGIDEENASNSLRELIANKFDEDE